ncbi:diacylglycerol kinase family protein [Bacteroides sp. OttesenSCG-928-D19]|nr:diacylglycerol kinase family protein [Bacteroides sp. OttesenSCG-928-D19]
MKPFSIKKRIESFKYAGIGIWKLIANEHNAWIHCTAVIVVTIAGFYFGINKYEWIIVTGCFGLVLAAEAINTAIEKLVDMVSPDKHPLAADVKDIAAGAVLLCAIASAIIGGIIFIPYIIS